MGNLKTSALAQVDVELAGVALDHRLVGERAGPDLDRLREVHPVDDRRRVQQAAVGGPGALEVVVGEPERAAELPAHRGVRELLVQPAGEGHECRIVGSVLGREERETLEDRHVVDVVLDGEPAELAGGELSRAQGREVAALQEPLDAGADDLPRDLVDEPLVVGRRGHRTLPPVGAIVGRGSGPVKGGACLFVLRYLVVPTLGRPAGCALTSGLPDRAGR